MARRENKVNSFSVAKTKLYTPEEKSSTSAENKKAEEESSAAAKVLKAEEESGASQKIAEPKEESSINEPDYENETPDAKKIASSKKSPEEKKGKSKSALAQQLENMQKSGISRTVYLSEENNKKITDIAKKYNTNVSKVINILIENAEI